MNGRLRSNRRLRRLF